MVSFMNSLPSLLLRFIIILFVSIKTKALVKLPPNVSVPAVLVFGDSIVDTGNNNNNLRTTARCNFPPYGKDFKGGIPTGRFSNGKVPSDLIGKLPIAAAPKRVVPLANVQPRNESTTVLVKVHRKWHVYSKHGGNKPISLELVLVDSEGTRIQGHLERMHIYKHNQQLHEGHVYAISKFVVASNVGDYRATRHNYRLNINLHTIICPAARSDSIPDSEIVFTPPAECFTKEFNQDYLVDVAGILTGLQLEYEFQKANDTSSRMKIVLENRGYRFTVQLFGEYVTEVKKLVTSPNGNNVVLAFLWCKVDTWQGI